MRVQNICNVYAKRNPGESWEFCELSKSRFCCIILWETPIHHGINYFLGRQIIIFKPRMKRRIVYLASLYLPLSLPLSIYLACCSWIPFEAYPRVPGLFLNYEKIQCQDNFCRNCPLSVGGGGGLNPLFAKAQIQQ